MWSTGRLESRKQLISPGMTENAVCAANFAPFLHFLEKSFSILGNPLALLVVWEHPRLASPLLTKRQSVGHAGRLKSSGWI
jgi:hypothetical protein